MQAWWSTARFEGNQAQGDFFFNYGGGGLYAQGSVDMSGTEFLSNTAARYGGGLLANGGVTGQNALFQSNGGSIGGGFYSAGPPSITGFRFLDNVAGAGGGLFTASPVSIAGSLFQGNEATGAGNSVGSGGGLYATTGTLDPPGIHDLAATQFIDNEAVASGGGAYLFGKTAIASSLFQDNVAAGPGGGLSAFVAYPDVLILNGTGFVRNVATGNGGGLDFFGWAELADVLFEDNQSLTGSGGGLYTNAGAEMENVDLLGNTAAGDGGGAFTNSGSTVMGSSFQGNISGGNGGGLSSPGGEDVSEGTDFANNWAELRGGGLYVNLHTISITGGTFSGNAAISDGGGLYAGRRLVVEGASFLRNVSGASGGGVYLANHRSGIEIFAVTNSLFAANTASSNGSGLYFEGENDTLEVVHNTFAAPSLVAGQALYAGQGALQILNTIVANHAVGITQAGSAVVNEDHILFFGNTTDKSGAVGGGAGSLTGNPGFVDPANDDYHLGAGSAAIDQGADAGVQIDFEGDARPLGAAPDMGYDEYVPGADGGFVTGGGWIESPAGAYFPDPTLTGRANYGFVSRYEKGAAIPAGNTEFQFKAGDLDFHSSSYDWLAVAGSKATFKGEGTINGGGSYGFLISALDADANTSDNHDADEFRIKIWDRNSGDAVVYDSQQCGDGADNADPCTEIGGSIVIHRAKP